MKKSGLILLVISFLMSCEKSLTVMETAQQWVEFYYKSDFEKAKMLSTQITKNMIDTVAGELIDEGEIMTFEIVHMNCLVRGDSAVCSYTYKDELDTVEEKINLIRIENKWLVDEPLVGEALTNDEVDMIFDDYEDLLKEELQNTLENE